MQKVLFAVFAVLAACGGDEEVGFDGVVVGGACGGNADCDERCLDNGEFPQGTCTVACATDADCPDDTFCIDIEDGVCLLGCTLPEDCRDGYSCQGESNAGRDGDSLVCIH